MRSYLKKEQEPTEEHAGCEGRAGAGISSLDSISDLVPEDT